MPSSSSAGPLSGTPLPGSEIALISLIFGLALLAIVIEIVRLLGGRSPTSIGQFWFRMAGSAAMMLMVALIAFGAIFVRPTDGRVFGWYWACTSLVLFGILMIVREDLARTRKTILADRRRLRDQSLREIQQIIDAHPRSTVSGDTPGASTGN